MATGFYISDIIKTVHEKFGPRGPQEAVMNSASMNWPGRPGILPVFFSLGLFALFSQTVLLRELMVVAWGNELVFGIGLGQ